jgi:hypothetical protein
MMSHVDKFPSSRSPLNFSTIQGIFHDSSRRVDWEVGGDVLWLCHRKHKRH